MVYSNNKAVVESTDILKGVPSNDSIYEFCDTYAEKAFALCAFAEGAYTELFESIGCNELAFYESTGKELDYVSEADEAKKANGGIKAFFQKIWGAIKAAYEKVIAWIDQNVKEFIKVNTENGIKDIRANWGKVKGSIADDKSFGKLGYSLDVTKKIDQMASSWSSQAVAFAADPSNKIDDIYNQVFGHNVESVSALQKTVRDELTLKDAVTVNKEFLDKNLESLIAIVQKGKLKDSIKKQYTEEKKMINDFIDKSEKIKNQSDQLKAQISLAKGTINVTNAAFMVLLDVDKKIFASSRNVLIAVLRALSKGEGFKEADDKEKFKGTKLKDTKVEPKQESAEEGEEKDLVTESINALFAW